MRRTRARAGTVPEDAYRLRDVRRSSYRAVPVSPLSRRSTALALKAVGQALDPLGEPLQRLGDRRIGRRRRRIGHAGAGADLLELVGEQQGGEQQLAGLGEAAERRGGVAGRAGRPSRRPSADAPPRRRGRRPNICAAGDLDLDRSPSAALPALEQPVDLADRASRPGRAAPRCASRRPLSSAGSAAARLARRRRSRSARARARSGAMAVQGALSCPIGRCIAWPARFGKPPGCG